jgi:hypothetical protein
MISRPFRQAILSIATYQATTVMQTMKMKKSRAAGLQTR